MAFIWGWLSDGLLRGRRWPFIYAGAFICVSDYSSYHPGLPGLMRVLTCGDVVDLQRCVASNATLLRHPRPEDRLLAQSNRVWGWSAYSELD